ncbi:helix-turn-helix domain-containing protein [Rothia nasimurium]|uniref:helix-turn-helix domain-containing protein n=1 Tax=Rothia nasimurium TaxID=85336 RepID=UPI003C6E25B1
MNNNETLTSNEAVAREVKTWMVRTNVKTTDLADAFGIGRAGVSKKLRGEAAFSIEDLLKTAGLMGISLSELLGESILNAKIPTTTELSTDGEKKIAPIGFIPNGATYEMVASTEPVLAGVGPAGLEPATKGL